MSAVVDRSRTLLDTKGPLSHAFFTSGQLMIVEFFTLAAIGKGGIGTPHMDGNTRWCTATAAAAFGESFGSDGQPGSYTDVDHCDAIFLFGHNVAETQSALWARMLDRLDGPNPPRLVCVDPRRTKVAERATVHLPIINGTNLALMNSLVHQLIREGYVDEGYVDAHTVGLEGLTAVTADATPEWAGDVCGVEPDDIRRAAEITNPAVSMPDLDRVRRTLSGDRCFVVVSDAYRTETTELADVVLPAALWAEKTGTFTNVDRTVHLQEQAVEPPGEARGDLHIFIDYARRMHPADRDGQPFPPWSTTEEAFGAWQAATAGRPCDYTGFSYHKLHDIGAMQWPCNESAPRGTERLYTDYPFRLTTGRTVYHWHTRTKTRRSKQLNDAAPSMWVEISPGDAQRLEVAEGDIVCVTSRRGSIEAPARISHLREGLIFAPWHFGDDGGPHTAANDLTIDAWDPVSKQPEFKVAAVAVERVRAGDGRAPAPIYTASAPAQALSETTSPKGA